MNRYVLEFDDIAAAVETHDRMIVDAARWLDAPCITVDPAMIDSKLVRVVW